MASDLGEQGFKWIFVMHNHGSPLYNLMLDQASNYFRDVYNGKMVNLPGLLSKPSQPEPFRAAEILKEEGAFEVHTGISDTSRILFLRPDLVPLFYLAAKPLTANTPNSPDAMIGSATSVRRVSPPLRTERRRCVIMPMSLIGLRSLFSTV